MNEKYKNRLNRKYVNPHSQYLHVVALENGRYQLCNTEWDVIKNSITAAEVIESIPSDYEPVGTWFAGVTV